MDNASHVGKQAMEDSDEDIEQLVLKQHEYMDTRAAELLDHDPELIALYQQHEQWKMRAKELQDQMIVLLESNQFALDLQNSIGTYKNVSDRIRTVLPDAFVREGMVFECAEAIEVAAGRLKQLAEEIRRRLAELSAPSIHDPNQMNKVQEAAGQSDASTDHSMTEASGDRQALLSDEVKAIR